MSFQIEFVEKARLELLDAWEWYEDKQTGLGDRFKEQVFTCLQKIGNAPERYPERKKHYREVVVPVFPYLLIYRINKRKKRIIIVSVFHTRRNPRKKIR